MILKFTNQERTAATFDGASFTLAAPEDWDSIGDGPTRERVKAWLAEGNEPEPYTAPEPVIPSIVTMRQARLALLQAGLLGQIEAAINAMESPMKDEARIEWEYSQEVHRNKPFVQQLSIALGLTEADMDQLFLSASTL